MIETAADVMSLGVIVPLTQIRVKMSIVYRIYHAYCIIFPQSKEKKLVVTNGCYNDLIKVIDISALRVLSSFIPKHGTGNVFRKMLYKLFHMHGHI